MKKQWVKKLSVVGLLGVLIFSNVAYGCGRNKSGSRNQLGWMDEVNLSSEQRQEITNMQDAMQPAMMEIRHQNRKLELEINKLNKAEKVDQAQVSVLRKTIVDNETAIQTIQSGHRTQIRTMLTDDQQIVFDNYGMGHADMRGNGNRGMKSNRNGKSCGGCNGKGSRG